MKNFQFFLGFFFIALGGVFTKTFSPNSIFTNLSTWQVLTLIGSFLTGMILIMFSKKGIKINMLPLTIRAVCVAVVFYWLTHMASGGKILIPF